MQVSFGNLGSVGPPDYFQHLIKLQSKEIFTGDLAALKYVVTY